jgi:DNA-binding response OmpR family regulator
VTGYLKTGVGKIPYGAHKVSGFTFRAMIDDIITQALEPASEPIQSRTNVPHRILVAEDDGDIRRLNTEILTHSGYLVDAAEDGDAAWNSLQVNSYDLLVTDNEMPKVSGVELIKMLHADKIALPVIMATGRLPMEEFTRQPWLTPAATLLKPYTVDELLITVKVVLRAIKAASPPDEPTRTWENQPPADGWLRL